MPFEKLTNFTAKVADLPDRPTLATAELKAQFDAAPDEVRVYLNQLIDALKATTTGDSGAKNIGATSISGLSGNDVQTLLEALKTSVDNVVVGQIPEGLYAKKTQEALIALVLQSGWVTYQDGFEGTYYKDELGRVYLSGRFKNGSTADATLLATLPTTHRPVKDNFIKSRNCDVLISTDGTIRLYNVTLPGDIGIDGLSFRAV